MIFLIEESSNVFSKKGRNLEILQFSFNFLDTRSFIDSCRVSPHQALSQSRLLTSRKISVNFSSRCGPSWPPDLEFTSTRKVTLNSDMTPRVTTPRVTCITGPSVSQPSLHQRPVSSRLLQAASAGAEARSYRLSACDRLAQGRSGLIV